MEREVLERMLDEGLSVAAIGREVGVHESTVAYWMQKHGLRSVNAERHRARGALSRGDLEPLVLQGLLVCANCHAEIEAGITSVGTPRRDLQ